MDRDILFESQEEKEATERVLANVRIFIIKNEINYLTEELNKYIREIDNTLEDNNLEKRYFEKTTTENIKLDDDLRELNFKELEYIEDLIKRINTRIEIVENYKLLTNELKEEYKIDESNLKEDLKIAKLEEKYFDEVLN